MTPPSGPTKIPGRAIAPPTPMTKNAELSEPSVSSLTSQPKVKSCSH
jgi:hypothetical protein